MKNTHRICSRKGCDDDGINKTNGHGSTWYCEKHYRFKRMRDVAQRRGKVVPSWEECETMLRPCLNEHGELGKCPSCGQQMRWRAGADRKRGPVLSLQHNHDGTMRFICLSCNAGHGVSKLGDLYLEPTPVGFKRCPDCDTVKPLGQFYKETNSRSGVRCICQNCDKERSRNYRAERNADPIKRAKYLAHQRENYRKYHAAKKTATTQLELD